MYNFLIAVGIIFIILGLYGDRTLLKQIKNIIKKLLIKEEATEEIKYIDEANTQVGEIDIYIDDKYVVEAEEKVDILIDEPIYDFVDEEEITFGEVLERVEDNISSNDNEAFDILEKYEAGEYTLEEVCNILNMKKGEVLLLRNIYKNSQD